MIMRSLFFVLLFVSVGLSATAQEDPNAAETLQLSVTLSDGPYFVGQPITLQVKILVPTWMPTPPVYPSFEQPNLLVRLPERSTHPVSETVQGDTWSGTSRTYRIYPLEPGDFQIPTQSLLITYADASSQPVQTEQTLNPIAFTVELPKGAQAMSPPVILATGFTLEQELASAGELAVGDALVRRVSAQIDGTTAILIPALIPDPVLTDTEDDTLSLIPI